MRLPLHFICVLAFACTPLHAQTTAPAGTPATTLTDLFAPPAQSPCPLPDAGSATLGLRLTQGTLACAQAAGLDPWAALLRKVGNREKVGPGWQRGNPSWDAAYRELERNDKVGAKERVVVLLRGAYNMPAIEGLITEAERGVIDAARKKPHPLFETYDESIAGLVALALSNAVDPAGEAGQRYYAQSDYLIKVQLASAARVLQNAPLSQAEINTLGPVIKLYATLMDKAGKKFVDASEKTEALYLPVYQASEPRLLELAREFKAAK
jgi:hypothetical protein